MQFLGGLVGPPFCPSRKAFLSRAKCRESACRSGGTTTPLIAMSAMTQPLLLLRRQASSVLRDYAELMKARVTTLIVMTAWCGYYFGAQKAGVSSLSWGLFHALLGIGLVSSGTAALNEVMEYRVDGHMRRTAQRPLPTGRMSLLHATIAGLVATLGGSIYLAIFTNPLTGLLTCLTSVVYLAAYTPLKRVSPICTFVGAFPGAMPGVLGWTAARGQLEWSEPGNGQGLGSRLAYPVADRFAFADDHQCEMCKRSQVAASSH